MRFKSEEQYDAMLDRITTSNKDDIKEKIEDLECQIQDLEDQLEDIKKLNFDYCVEDALEDKIGWLKEELDELYLN